MGRLCMEIGVSGIQEKVEEIVGYISRVEEQIENIISRFSLRVNNLKAQSDL